MGYGTRAAFYRRGVKHLFGTDCEYIFLIAEDRAPFLCSMVGIDPMGKQMGDEKAAYAIAEWERCVKANRFPGYPRRVAYPETKPWEQAAWLERQGIDIDTGIPYSIDKLFERKKS